MTTTTQHPHDIETIASNHPIRTCNGFAWNYKKANPHVEVRDGLVQGDFHCYIYDPETDCIIDPTLDQFDGHDAGVFNGDTHPHIDAPHEVRVWESHDEFVSHYDQPHGPYLLNK